MRPVTDWDAETRLGKIPDEELAAALSCAVSTVRHQRIKRKIKTVRQASMPEPMVHVSLRVTWPDWKAAVKVARQKKMTVSRLIRKGLAREIKEVLSD